jgi:hypothetical protein
VQQPSSAARAVVETHGFGFGFGFGFGLGCFMVKNF